jgi:PhzF family phenazine biosynthesis protein
MKLPFYWIDSFAREPFTGNPAGVVPLASWPDDALMQKIAFENGLAETAFFVRISTERYHLRWFTPVAEVDLCGHATLASAYVVFNEMGLETNRVTFDSRSGPLVVSRLGDRLLELDFPALATTPASDPNIVLLVEAAIGVKPLFVGRTPFDHLALLPDAGAVRALCPDFAKVAGLGGRGLIVTATGEPGVDFVSRFFAPQVGIPEDPVTGSAHCALVPFWASRLGQRSLHARQVSTRGGDLQCALDGNRVRLAGNAVLYLRGEIQV